MRSHLYIFIPSDCVMAVGGDEKWVIVPSKSSRSNLSRNFCNSGNVNSILSSDSLDKRITEPSCVSRLLLLLLPIARKKQNNARQSGTVEYCSNYGYGIFHFFCDFTWKFDFSRFFLLFSLFSSLCDLFHFFGFLFDKELEKPNDIFIWIIKSYRF